MGLSPLPPPPRPLPENPTIDFRAPPPSPVASGRRSCFTNEDVLTDFLEHSLKVPDLVLPDKIFPQQQFVETPPAIDFGSLDSDQSDSILKILDSIEKIGCFQVVNCGIPAEVVSSALADAAGVFRVLPEKRKAVTRSPDSSFGFEVSGEEESELSEEFVWCRDERLEIEMEGIWPLGYSYFSRKMNKLAKAIEYVGEKILEVIQKDSTRKSTFENDMVSHGKEVNDSICCVYKHNRNIPDDQWVNSLKYDVIRMLIRGSNYSHALCLHVCDGFSEFHVYSKRGWVSFRPAKDALVITIGDQIQALSGGKYKQVIGRPIYKGEEKCISMAFLYSPTSNAIANNIKTMKEKTISIGQQAMVALIFTILCQFLIFIYNKF